VLGDARLRLLVSTSIINLETVSLLTPTTAKTGERDQEAASRGRIIQVPTHVSRRGWKYEAEIVRVRKHLQGSDSENSDKHLFLAAGKVQAPNNRHRKDDYH